MTKGNSFYRSQKETPFTRPVSYIDPLNWGGKNHVEWRDDQNMDLYE